MPAWPLGAGLKLKLAYVSGHFLDHPMMQMMSGMFRLHDKSKVMSPPPDWQLWMLRVPFIHASQLTTHPLP